MSRAWSELIMRPSVRRATSGRVREWASFVPDSSEKRFERLLLC